MKKKSLKKKDVGKAAEEEFVRPGDTVMVMNEEGTVCDFYFGGNSKLYPDGMPTPGKYRAFIIKMLLDDEDMFDLVMRSYNHLFEKTMMGCDPECGNFKDRDCVPDEPENGDGDER
jgi:hypothetical protein